MKRKLIVAIIAGVSALSALSAGFITILHIKKRKSRR
jgi:hypothetical protein